MCRICIVTFSVWSILCRAPEGIKVSKHNILSQVSKDAVLPGILSCNLSCKFVASLWHKLRERLGNETYHIKLISGFITLKTRFPFYFQEFYRLETVITCLIFHTSIFQ